MSFVITEPMVRKLLATVDAGLVKGLGEPEPGKMCVEAAISYALGEPHSDGPSCVDPIVRTAKIALNDAIWSSNAARAKGMRRVAIAQLGSKGTIDSGKFVRLLAEYTIREVVPLALKAAVKLNPSHSALLEEAANRCAEEGTKDAADAAYAAADAADDAAADAADAAAYAADSADAAYAAYAADAAYAAADAAEGAANAAVYAAAYAAYAAADAAYAAADAADDAADDAAVYAAVYAAAKAADDAERDKMLSLGAALIVRALQECNSPGCDWLWLVDETHIA